MDYSYLNQAAASFDSSCLQSGMDPTGLNMPCSYGDLTSCNQMSQAAYRYTAAQGMRGGFVEMAGLTSDPHESSLHKEYLKNLTVSSKAAAATMARSYNPVGTGVGGPGNTGMSALHHGGGPGSQCSVMGTRTHQDVHRASMFPSSMNLQCKLVWNY
jgi:hypothetical protein